MFRTAILQTLFVFVAFIVISSIRETALLDDSVESPQFHLPSLNDGIVSLSEFEGKQTVVYFFAPWCSVCKYSISNLDKVDSTKTHVVAVALDYESVDSVRKFSEGLALNMPVLLGNAATKQNYKIQGYPTYYVLDENQRITSKSMGYSTELGLRLRTEI